MIEIVITTFNARYTHTSIGLRYLFANLKELQPRAKILEFVINSSVPDAVESILAQNPKIVGIGAYIWNALEVHELITILKKVAPHITIVLGGPEASYLPHRVDFSKLTGVVIEPSQLAGKACCDVNFSGVKFLGEFSSVFWKVVNLEEV